TTVESICRTFRLMERKKIIKSKTPRCFEIIDKPALFRAAGLEEPSCPAGPSALGIQAPEIEPSYELKRAANFM
ncbi:hypothetical protein, partial [Roseibium sp.]|uniref:hypothetical protein n=1 Tax=Roseibium sp. TaxID=1936156 RepID=UPI003D0FB0BC